MSRRKKHIATGSLCPITFKQNFASYADANKRARQIRMGKSVRLHPYRCECGHWHLGH